VDTIPETHHKEKIVVFVNGEKFDFDTNTVQVKTLITLGGGIPGEYELQLRKGEHGPVITTYTDPNQTITIKNGEHFTTKFTGPINPA
jgi:hypothetical protein